MTSWRESVSQSAQDDLDGLLNLVLPLAEDLLGKHAEFYPFGGTVSNDGEVALTGAPHLTKSWPASIKEHG